MALGNIWHFVMCDVVDIPLVDECGIQDPRTVRNDFVNPTTMSDGFTSERYQQSKLHLGW